MAEAEQHPADRVRWTEKPGGRRPTHDENHSQVRHNHPRLRNQRRGVPLGQVDIHDHKCWAVDPQDFECTCCPFGLAGNLEVMDSE